MKLELNDQKVVEIVKNSLTLDQWWTLNKMLHSKDVIFCNTVDLQVAGWCDQHGNLTSKAKNLIEKLENQKITGDFTEIYFCLQNEMLKLTGKKQKVIQKKYSFLPNEIDLTNKLTKVINKYKLNDLNLVKKCLIMHLNNSYRAKWEFVKTIEYFISKNDSSDLVTMYLGWKDLQELNKEEKEENQPKEVKNLF